MNIEQENLNFKLSFFCFLLLKYLSRNFKQEKENYTLLYATPTTPALLQFYTGNRKYEGHNNGIKNMYFQHHWKEGRNEIKQHLWEMFVSFFISFFILVALFCDSFVCAGEWTNVFPTVFVLFLHFQILWLSKSSTPDPQQTNNQPTDRPIRQHLLPLACTTIKLKLEKNKPKGKLPQIVVT